MQSGFCKQKTREPPTPQDRSVSVEGGVRSTVTLLVLCSQCLRAALEDTYVGRDLRDVGILLSWRYMSPLLCGCKSSTVLRMAWFKVNLDTMIYQTGVGTFIRVGRKQACSLMQLLHWPC